MKQVFKRRWAAVAAVPVIAALAAACSSSSTSSAPAASASASGSSTASTSSVSSWAPCLAGHRIELGDGPGGNYVKLERATRPGPAHRRAGPRAAPRPTMPEVVCVSRDEELMAKGEHAQLSTLDCQLVACLQTNGRASWSAIAAVTCVSETTVARRVQQLTDSGMTHIVGVLDAFRAGLGMPTLVRIGCAPGMADAVAAAIAARDDVRTVTMVTGVADIVAEFIVPDRTAMHRLLVQELPAVDGLRSNDCLVVLRTFRSALLWDRHFLDREATAQLRPQEPPPFEAGTVTAAIAELDDVDRAIAAGLGEDGRMPYRDLAARAGVSETTVARRVESLVSGGCLHFRTLVAPQLLGFSTEAMLWLTVDARYLDRVGRRLVEEPSVRYLVATAGSYHMAGRVALAEHQDLYELLTERIGPLPGVRDVEVTFELQTLKRSWVLGADTIPDTIPAGTRNGRGAAGLDG